MSPRYLKIFSVFVILLFSSPLFADQIADRVLLEKSKRQLTLYSDGKEIASFVVSLGRSPVGAKECDGDNKTPEGKYLVTEHKSDSAYHRALRLSYPTNQQIDAAKVKGCNPGSDIMIHGIRNGFGWLRQLHRIVDWTRGCIAVTNEEIEKLWAMVPDGTPVEIRS